MKKLVSILLSIVLICCCFSACSSSKKEEKTTVAEMEKVSEIPQERIAQKKYAPATSFAAGDGTKESPFEISNAAELQFFADIFNDFKISDSGEYFDHKEQYQKAYYVLTDDIVINSDSEMKKADEKAPTYYWTPIGSKSDDPKVNNMNFEGNFDGRGHSVSGLYTCVLGNATGEDACLGFFAKVANATISNVTIKNSYFYAYNTVWGIAALSGNIYKTAVVNCNGENNKIFAHSGSIGGLIGDCLESVNIVSCSVSGQVKGGYSSEVAGITASVSDGIVKNCTNNAEVIAYENADASGICCSVSDSSFESGATPDKDGSTQITGCVNNGKISGESFSSAGIVARLSSGKGKVVVNDCKNSGSVSSKQEVGGIVGSLVSEMGTLQNKQRCVGTCVVKNCENTGEISGDNMVSGIVGHTNVDDGATAIVKNCVNNNKIKASVAAGIIGTPMIYNDSTISVVNCVNNAEILTTSAAAGGIVGMFLSAVKDECNGYLFEISDCTNNGVVSNKDYGSIGDAIDNCCIGGILGKKFSSACKNDAFVISNCTNTADFFCESDSYVGGIIGYVLSSSNEKKLIEDCTASGTINFAAKVYGSDNEVHKSMESKVVNYVGGIAGTAQDTVEFKNCNSTVNFNLTFGERKRVRFANDCPFVVKSK